MSVDIGPQIPIRAVNYGSAYDTVPDPWLQQALLLHECGPIERWVLCHANWSLYGYVLFLVAMVFYVASASITVNNYYLGDSTYLLSTKQAFSVVGAVLFVVEAHSPPLSSFTLTPFVDFIS